jgi:hypothetical protein
MYVILATWKVAIGKIAVQGQLRQISPQDLISKITRAKWTGGMDQAVECLLCKYKAPSSNSKSTPKKSCLVLNFLFLLLLSAFSLLSDSKDHKSKKSLPIKKTPIKYNKNFLKT